MFAMPFVHRQPRRGLLPFIAAVWLAMLAACNSDTGASAGNEHADTSGSEVRSALARDTANVTIDADVLTAAADNNRFAERLLARLQQDNHAGDNLAFSPYSLTQALAMTAAGATGATLSGIESALSFTLPGERRDAALNKLDLLLKQRTDDGDRPSLVVANDAWAQRGFPLRNTYLDRLARYYGAGVRLQDFRSDPEPPRQAINAAVAATTRGRIPEILGAGALTRETRLVLTNAVWFKARWRTPFSAGATSPRAFVGLDGGATEVPFMWGGGGFAYADTVGFQAVELPYRGDKLSMLLLMPKGDFASFVADGNRLTEVATALRGGFVALSTPKFKFEAETKVTQALKDFGMTEAFQSDAADFSAMFDRSATEENLYVAKIAHKAFIAVDEDGTEAAAATAVIVGGISSMPTYDAVLNFDRPFLFAIRERDTGVVLFLGAVLKP